MFKIIRKLNFTEWLLMLLAFALIAFQVYLELKIPEYTKEIVLAVETNDPIIKEVLKPGGIMLLCSAISLISAVIVGYITSVVSSRLSQRLREQIYNKVASFSMEQINQFSTASLITRTTNDVTNLQMFFGMGIQMLIKAPITAIWAVAKILNKNLQLSLLTGGATVILIVSVVVIMALVFPRFKKVQTYIDNLNNLTKEQLTGIRVVRAFNAEKYQETKFEKGNKTLTDTQIFNQRTLGILDPIMYLVFNGLTLSICWLGAALINKTSSLKAKIEMFADVFTFTSYASMVLSAFLMLVMIFIMLPRASVSADRINQVLETPLTIFSGEFEGKTKVKGEIEFKNVSFKYPNADEYMLKNISFKVKSGETIAFIGSTGSGKSTLVNLLMRFYDCTEGEILVDGVNIKDYKLQALYSRLGYVPQRAVILGGSVKDNIAFGKDANTDSEAIKQSLAVAQADDFVEKMEGGIEAQLAQGGTNVSGGQKQRLSIARAVNKKPEIYIFDDAFSALDYKTDYKVRTNLKKYTKNATNVIVAARIGTIMNADQIIVLEKGEAVGIGTHKQLLKNCKVYKEIAYSQLSKQEAENA